MIFNNLWIEKWRPSKFDEIVLSEANRKAFADIKQQGSIPNLAFLGHHGIGKTTLSKVIVRDVLDCQYMYLNASDESGIDTIRTKVVGFAQTKSIDGKIKIIILDEADGLTMDAQRTLRNTMEEYSQITRFVITANYAHRIIPAVQSRCISYDLTPPMEGCIARLEYILTQEKIKYTKADVEAVMRRCYPDLRKAIGEVQRYSSTGVLMLPVENELSTFVEQIFKLLKGGHVLKIRKWVIENEPKFSGDYPNLLRTLFDYVYEQKMEDDLKKKYLITISEYIYRSSFVLDPEINFYSCIVQLSETH